MSIIWATFKLSSANAMHLVLSKNFILVKILLFSEFQHTQKK